MIVRFEEIITFVVKTGWTASHQESKELKKLRVHLLKNQQQMHTVAVDKQ